MAGNLVTRTSELQAVNVMLQNIGEAPVNSLQADQVMDDVATARLTLNEISKAVQAEGWYFNTETEMVLKPNTDGKIVVPQHVAHIWPRWDTENEHRHISLRGDFLYNRQAKSYKFDKDVKVNATVFLTWYLLPEPARRYIMIRAARVFADRTYHSQTLHQYTANDEMAARTNLLDAEAEDEEYNMFDAHDFHMNVKRGRKVIW